MKSFVGVFRYAAICILAVIMVFLFSCSDSAEDLYNGEFLEKKLSLPYNIEGILTQNGEKYDVIIEGIGNGGETASANETVKTLNGEFKIKFMSGDVTEGLTVEFFDNGVFLFFDDLRFKTNSETFTNLESLKNSFETLSAPYIEKYVTDLAPVDGIDIIEIGVTSEKGDIKAYVNQLDGTIIRLMTNFNGADITLDIKKFENNMEAFNKNTAAEEETSRIFEVVDDYFDM